MQITLLAHQGGWDEILFAAGPIALIVGLLWLANSRAKRLGGVPTGADTESVTEPVDGAADSGANGAVRPPATPD